MNCRWGSYQPWSECTKTCGGGTRESIREVEQKEEHGGLPCVGSAKRIVACNKETCPGDTFVSADLKYIHMLNIKIHLGIINCSTFSSITFLFIVDCEWGEFGEWGGCSQTCGEGIQTRTRSVKRFAKFGGILCTGYSTESKPCNLQKCPGKVCYGNGYM